MNLVIMYNLFISYDAFLSLNSKKVINISYCYILLIMPRDLKHVIEGLENIKNKAAEVVIRRKEEDNMVDIETGKVTIPNIKHFFNDF